MKKSQDKSETTTGMIRTPKPDYQPSKAEKEQEIDMPGASVEIVKDAFFRPVKTSE